MKYPITINGVRLVVDVEPRDTKHYVKGAPQKFVVLSVTGISEDISELLDSDVWKQIREQAQAALEFQQECQRPDESAKVPFAVEYVGKVMDMAFNAAMGKKTDKSAEIPEREYYICSHCEGCGREAGHFGLSKTPCSWCKGTGQGPEIEPDEPPEPDMNADGPAERAHREDTYRGMK